MTFKTYEINVDLVHDTSTTCSNRFSQNDRNSAKLLVTITNKGAELDLSQAKSVRMSFKKPDGTRVFQNDCQPINAMKGKYQIVLKTQTLTSVGNVIAQIHIEEEDRIIDTQKFFFVVNDSLASDEAVESTNEFTIIQKAIEAGKKLEGVDINGIIAAGELAKGALPKSGGTMTGNIDLDTSVGSKSKGYRWRDATGAIFGLETSTTGELILYDYKAAARIWQYDPVAKRFSVNSDGNLLKTTGGTITGTTIFEAGDLRFKNAANDILFRNNTSGIFSFYDIAQNQVVWSYNPTTKEFTVNSASNLLKKTGDTATGDIIIKGANKVLQVSNGTESLSHSVDNNSVYYWYSNLAKTPLRYDIKTDTFNVLAANTNVLKKNGDTMTGNLEVPRVTTTNAIPLVFNGVAGASKSWKTSVDGKGITYTPSKTTGVVDWDDTKAVNISTNGEITATKFNTLKDGRATITVTADAELTSSDGVVADRRGNTVTVRARVRRKSEQVNLIFTMPEGMRPLLNVSHNLTANDGTPGMLTIAPTSGEVRIASVGPALLNKDFNFTFTYVVD
ncbi:BppU family phage baseplate upper protein [Bacillus paranthracis]|uniref:BppU family phage baseplate upper protein n=2 Tax=Bacillus paranthracis TaxID=2026186 RepID=UPI0013CFA90D|nr:BppU family phage baseplate upper protein [Bacillus paranthracis]